MVVAAESSLMAANSPDSDEQAVSTVRLEVESAFAQGTQRLIDNMPWPLKIKDITYAVCKNTGSGMSTGIWSQPDDCIIQ